MSFLRNYLSYATDNEAPELFHVWSAYAVLSAAISRRVWLPFGDEAIYPNIYVMLVGDAGNGKSHALRKAKRLLSELGDIPMSRSMETPPGLWRFMNGDPNTNPPTPSPVAFPVRWPDGQLREVHPMTIIANEFINFIGLDQAGWTNALNDIYDEDNYEYRTKNKGEDKLLGPYIVLLGALTTEVSSDLQKARIISTGFARRTIFQYGERKWHDPHPFPGAAADSLALKNKCVEHARSLKHLHGAFEWTEESLAWWDTFYRDHTAKIPKHAPQVKSWFASKPHQILKLAMLTALSERIDLKLQISDLQIALAYLDEMEVDLFKVFGGVGRNELAAVALKVFDFVSSQDEPTSIKRLRTSFWNQCKPPNDFNECVTFLCDSGKLIQCALTVDKVTDLVIATPEVMSAFAAKVGAVLPQADVTPVSSLPGESPVAGPSVLPPGTLESEQERRQAIARRIDGIATEQPRSAETEIC